MRSYSRSRYYGVAFSGRFLHKHLLPKCGFTLPLWQSQPQCVFRSFVNPTGFGAATRADEPNKMNPRFLAILFSTFPNQLNFLLLRAHTRTRTGTRLLSQRPQHCVSAKIPPCGRIFRRRQYEQYAM